MPLTTTGAGVSSSNVPDTISSGDGVSDLHKSDNVVLEDINIAHGGDDSIVVEERERNLHSKKHRR